VRSTAYARLGTDTSGAISATRSWFRPITLGERVDSAGVEEIHEIESALLLVFELN